MNPAVNALNAARAPVGPIGCSSGSSAGEGVPGDLDALSDCTQFMDGKCICALADGASWAARAFLKQFRADYEAHITATQMPVPGELRRMSGRVTRNQVVAMFGTPDHTAGQPQQPGRTRGRGHPFQREMDLRASRFRSRRVLRCAQFTGIATTSWVPACATANDDWRDDTKLAEALAGLDDRLQSLTVDHNLPNTPRTYRPVSKPKDVSDLGGYFQVFDDKE